MSHLRNHLTGKQSQIVYKRYLSKAGSIYDHLCIIRFEVDGWSSVVYGVGTRRYLAGSRALQNYIAFCETYGILYRDNDGVLSESDADTVDYSTNDEAYGDSL